MGSPEMLELTKLLLEAGANVKAFNSEVRAMQ